VDTAGLRDKKLDIPTEHDSIELEGMRRALAVAEYSDFVLIVVDCALPSAFQDAEKLLQLLEERNIPRNKTGLVLNKKDLCTDLDSLRFMLNKQWIPVWENCALEANDSGIAANLSELIKEKWPEGSDLRADEHLPILTLARQRGHLTKSASNLRDHLECLKVGESVFAAEHLRIALRSLGAITGHVDGEAILDALFSRFCIGK